MSSIVNLGLLLLVLCSYVVLSLSEADDSPPSDHGKVDRKRYDVDIYPGTEVDAFPLRNHSPRSLVAQKYVPYKHAGSGILKKSGNDFNWNAWKGDENNSGDDDSDNNASPSGWQPPPQAWNSDSAWVADPMTVMLFKNAMAEIKGNNKPAGFLSKITADPALLLIAASIPISMLLAAVLPAIMNGLMSGTNVPIISTTATGPKSRSSHMDITPYLSSIMEAIGTFSVRSINNPDCMQRIICQVAKDKIASYNSKYFKEAATVARFLSEGSWLEHFGLKGLVDSLSSGNCESIPCLHSSKKNSSKSKYSQKVHSNYVKK